MRWPCYFVVLLVLLMTFAPAPVAADGGAAWQLVYYPFPQGEPKWLLPVGIVVPGDFTRVRATLEALCQGPPPNQILDPAFPRGTRVKRISLGTTAHVDFNAGFVQVRGERAARLAAQALVHTLSQFPSVEKVRVTVEGKTIPALAGVPLDQPLLPDPSVVYPGYSDVADHPARSAILALTLRGVLTGYPDGAFRPWQPVTRGEALKSLVEVKRILTGARWELPVVAAAGEEWFTDVKPGHWLYPYLRQAVREDLVAAPDPGERFAPGQPLSGEQAVSWLKGVGWEGAAPEGDMVSRGDWADLLARLLGWRGPDLYLCWPAPAETLAGEALVAGAVRWREGKLRVAILDARGRELAVRVVFPRGQGWFAEWLEFSRPLTPNAGVVEARQGPPPEATAAPSAATVPVFLR